MNVRFTHAALALLALAAAGPCLAEPPQPAEFAWRAALEMPAGASVVRVSLPAQALMQLQTSDARDIRVFNAQKEAVAYAFASPPQAQPAQQLTRGYAAHPLFSASQNAKAAKGAVRVRIDGAEASRSVWVQIDGAAAPAAEPSQRRLNSAIFATKDEKSPLRALAIQAELPANAPVRITAATSPDLAQWTPVALRGRLYRFDGGDGLANNTLELDQPLKLEGRYLRLDWEGHDGVAVASVAGVIASAAPSTRVRATLPPPTRAGTALEWPIAFATPISALALNTPQPNGLVPVRVLGRREAAQPWRQLAQTLVYRLGAAGSETTNPPVPLNGASVRWLRAEATNGMTLGGAPLEASVEFEPVQLVFIASGSGPFELAAGRPDTPGANIAIHLLSAAVTGKIDDLPQARVGAITSAGAAPAASDGPLAWLVPAGIPSRTLWLWGILGGGVLLLGGVAWSLLRQLKTSPPAS